MCHVIISFRSVIWTLLCIASFLMIFTSIVSPRWLIGYGRPPGLVASVNRIYPTSTTSRASKIARIDNYKESSTTYVYNPTLGIFNRCVKMDNFVVRNPTEPFEESCAIFVTDIYMSDDNFPLAWKAVMILFGVGNVLLFIGCLGAIGSFCFGNICGKSIINICGFLQGLSGEFISKPPRYYWQDIYIYIYI